MKYYLVITTCLKNKYGIKNKEFRQKTYKHSIERALFFLPKEIIPIIVENSGISSSFLDDFGVDVVYTDNNKYNFPRPTYKGKNELLDIQSVISKYDIQDDDIVIKLTGRYEILDDTFFRCVLENCHSHDAFIKFYNVSRKIYMDDDCALGLYAIKCKHLKSFDFSYKHSPEVDFAVYVKKSCEFLEIKNLSLKYCFADNNKTLVV